MKKKQSTKKRAYDESWPPVRPSSLHQLRATLDKVVAAPPASGFHKDEVYRSVMRDAILAYPSHPHPDGHRDELIRLAEARRVIARKIGGLDERRVHGCITDGLKYRLHGLPPDPRYAVISRITCDRVEQPITFISGAESALAWDQRYEELFKRSLNFLFEIQENQQNISTGPFPDGAEQVYEKRYAIGSTGSTHTVMKRFWSTHAAVRPPFTRPPMVAHLHAPHTEISKILSHLDHLYDKVLTHEKRLTQVTSLAEYEWWSFQSLLLSRGGASVSGSLSICMQNAIGLPLGSQFEKPDWDALVLGKEDYIGRRIETFRARYNARSAP
ncbi:MAG: hypothetical protein CL917_03470 [Deltaproteobacteria bacterium]|nr:hypothetical protein [Deltaproteobacteria bacterium]